MLHVPSVPTNELVRKFAVHDLVSITGTCIRHQQAHNTVHTVHRAHRSNNYGIWFSPNPSFHRHYRPPNHHPHPYHTISTCPNRTRPSANSPMARYRVWSLIFMRKRRQDTSSEGLFQGTERVNLAKQKGTEGKSQKRQR